MTSYATGPGDKPNGEYARSIANLVLRSFNARSGPCIPTRQPAKMRIYLATAAFLASSVFAVTARSVTQFPLHSAVDEPVVEHNDEGMAFFRHASAPDHTIRYKYVSCAIFQFTEAQS